MAIFNDWWPTQARFQLELARATAVASRIAAAHPLFRLSETLARASSPKVIRALFSLIWLTPIADRFAAAPRITNFSLVKNHKMLYGKAERCAVCRRAIRMKTYTLIAVLALLLSSLAVGQSKPRLDRAPLPDKVTSAKTVFLLNETDAKLGDAIYRELKKWNRWELVRDRSKADLLIVVSQQETAAGVFSTATTNTTASTATATGLAVPVTDKSWFLHILDARTGENMWTVKARLSFWGKTWNGMAKQLVGDIKDRM